MERKKVAILFSFSEKWMGGVIYILNIIRTLNFLDDKDKPVVTVFYRKELRRFLDEVEYPYLELKEWEFINIYKGYLLSWLSGRNRFVEKIVESGSFESVFPVLDFPVRSSSDVRLVSWYADLQHKYYPSFFSKKKIAERNARIKLILRNCSDLVLSSNAVHNDFKKFFKLRDSQKIHIYHFVSITGNYNPGESAEGILKKYKLPEKYFLVSNQFHRHKNHIVLIKALKILKERNRFFHIAMTGKLPDDNNAAHILELKNAISESGLDNQLTFLGVISRSDQLQLMKYSQAVIQPSLFEGWSTVIEDAMSLQVPVIASSLAVNIEQLGEFGTFFDPENENELAEIIEGFNFPGPDITIYPPYSERIREAANNLLRILTGTE